MRLDERTLRLIAVGASVAANCQSCLQINIAQTLECGADEQDIAEAIWVGKMVRGGAASKMDAFVLTLNQQDSLSSSLPGGSCECIG